MTLFGICFQISAQSFEKSSGVKQLNMKKKLPSTTSSSTTSTSPTSPRSSEGSVQMKIDMKQKPVVELNNELNDVVSGDVSGFTWISPVFTSVRTSEDTYDIEATVNSDENIRFVNLFNNGRFVRNIIPPVSNIMQMAIEEPMELTLGRNDLKMEVVTVSGKKLVVGRGEKGRG